MDIDDNDNEETNRKKGVGRRIWNILLVLVFGALVGGVLYLLSERNARMYYAVPTNGKLVIMRGQFLPQGEEPYRPETVRLAAIYAPIDIPTWTSAPAKLAFDERAELDVGVADLLIKWARSLVETGTQEAAADCVGYLERARQLPAISPKQKAALAEIETEVAYYQAQGMLQSAIASLRRAADRLKVAAGSKGPNARKSLLLLPSVDGHIEALVTTIDAPTVPAAPPEDPAAADVEPAVEPAAAETSTVTP